MIDFSKTHSFQSGHAWTGGKNTNASWRRSEGVCWYNGKRVRSTTWRRDNGNGTSAKPVKQSIH
jgi:hypothetical protein